MPKYKITYTFERETASALERVRDDWKERLDNVTHPNAAPVNSSIAVWDITPRPQFKTGTIVSGMNGPDSTPRLVKTATSWVDLETGTEEIQYWQARMQSDIEAGYRTVLFEGLGD